MLLCSEVQLCGVLGAAEWGFRCSCVGFLGAGAAVWRFWSRCSCVGFRMQVQLCGVLGADRAAVWGFRSRCSRVGF